MIRLVNIAKRYDLGEVQVTPWTASPSPSNGVSTSP